MHYIAHVLKCVTMGFFKGVIIKGLQGPLEFNSKGFPQHK